MKIEQVKMRSPMSRLMYWIKERESIRVKKEQGLPKPWTDDTILQSFRFCNVRRMDDKVSKWLLENWYEPNRDHPNMLLAVALARFVNLPSSLEAVGFPRVWKAAEIKKTLRKQRERGAIFNGAYVVRGNDGEDKVASVVDYYVSPLKHKLREVIGEHCRMQEAHAVMSECYGFGSFMAGQVVADLRWGISRTWSDKSTWAPIGPGSKRGMNRLYERDLKSPLSQEDFEEELTRLIRECRNKLPEDLMKRLEAIDYQNCLCEFDKYERCLWGEGKPKQRYEGQI